VVKRARSRNHAPTIPARRKAKKARAMIRKTPASELITGSPTCVTPSQVTA
jgi:hypothetical protein